MKIATWNINSLRVRLPQVLDWLASEKPDLLALQETKLPDAEFPSVDFEAIGYHCNFNGQKTYNGVATLSRASATQIMKDLPGANDPQRRFLATTQNNVRFINVYIPNGQEVGSEKYAYKLDWLDQLQAHLEAELEKFPELILLGDFNIAPEDRDVYDPQAWKDQVLCSQPEREAFQGLLDLGLCDAFRLLEAGENFYSWWDYRQGAFRRNRGLRIDHILVSAALAERCIACAIDTRPRTHVRPSDHTPVWAKFA